VYNSPTRNTVTALIAIVCPRSRALSNAWLVVSLSRLRASFAVRYSSFAFGRLCPDFAAMPMPELSVDKDSNSSFGPDDIGFAW